MSQYRFKPKIGMTHFWVQDGVWMFARRGVVTGHLYTGKYRSDREIRAKFFPF